MDYWAPQELCIPNAELSFGQRKSHTLMMDRDASIAIQSASTGKNLRSHQVRRVGSIHWTASLQRPRLFHSRNQPRVFGSHCILLRHPTECLGSLPPGQNHTLGKATSCSSTDLHGNSVWSIQFDWVHNLNVCHFTLEHTRFHPIVPLLSNLFTTINRYSITLSFCCQLRMDSSRIDGEAKAVM